MLAAYTDELQHYPPQAVLAGCLQWARQKATWPALSELVGFIEVNDRSPALPSPTDTENFLARCKRLGAPDAMWVRERHHLLEEAMRLHADGNLSDEQLTAALDAAAEGKPVVIERQHRREPTDDDRVLRAWMNNDRQAEVIRQNPSAYACGPALVAAHANFRERRFRTNPALAAKYYGAVQ